MPQNGNFPKVSTEEFQSRDMRGPNVFKLPQDLTTIINHRVLTLGAGATKHLCSP